ncbi:MAG: 23S rRNA (guanosine2251-2'-O)-methyltransferase [Lysobacterales bacterium]|jgi:23S rRNA (guanosine2251-2'-O)-methyltransferase
MRKLSHEELLDRQKDQKNQKSMPICAVLNDIRSLHNVGSIFRTADGAGVAKIWICGITGHPPKNQIAKTALGAEDSVDWEYRENIIDVLKTLKQEGWQIVFLEQIEGSIVYDDFTPDKPVAIVLGNEIEGISDEVLAFCDQAIEIDMAGVKNSLNVSVAFGIITYHLRSCFKKIKIV